MSEKLILTDGQLEDLTTTVEEIEQALQACAAVVSCELKFDLYTPGNKVTVTALYDNDAWTYELEAQA